MQFMNPEQITAIIHSYTLLPIVEEQIIVKPTCLSESIYEANQLLPLLSDKRACEFTYWYTVGTILYNISKGARDGLLSWISFSKRSNDVFTEESCITYWIGMKNTTHNIGTLLYYVKEDNMDRYMTYKHDQCTSYLVQYNRENDGVITNYAYARALYILYKDEFLYSNGWYQFVQDKWIYIKECTELRGYIPSLNIFIKNEVVHYRKLLEELDNELKDEEEKIIETGTEEDERHTVKMEQIRRKIKCIEGKRKHFLQSRRNVENTAFKNSIIAECKDIFFDKNGLLRTCNYGDVTIIAKVDETIITKVDETEINNISNENKGIMLVKKQNESIQLDNKIYIDEEIETRLKDIKWKKSNTYKRVRTIITDFKFTKSIIVSQKVKEFFLRNDVNVVEDKKNGHKIYIEY